MRRFVSKVFACADWGLIVLLAISFGLGMSQLFRNHEQLGEEVTLVVDFVSSQPGRFEVFWDEGDGFVVSRSASFQNSFTDLRSVENLKIPIERIKHLRVDPLDCAGEFTIYSLYLENGLGKRIVFDLATLKWEVLGDVKKPVLRDGAVFIESLGDDPALILLKDATDFEYLGSQLLVPAKPAWIDLLLALVLFGLVCIGYRVVGHWILPVMVAVAVWVIQYPGVFSPDSVWQVIQAQDGEFSNWHPPVMAIMLHGWLKLGLNVGTFMLAQVLIGTLLLQLLLEEWVRVLRPGINDRKLRHTVLGVSAFVFAFLMSPLTPYGGFVIAFWKDTWIFFALTGVIAMALRLYRTLGIRTTLRWDRLCWWVQWVALVLFMVLSMLLRHNAIALVPIFILLLWMLLPPGFWKGLSMALAGGALLTFVVGNPTIERMFRVEDFHPEMSVMAVETVGLLVLFPKLKPDFPYVSSQLREDYRERFRWSDHQEMKWGADSYVLSDLMRDGMNPSLRQEYMQALLRYPLHLAAVKTRNFLELLIPAPAIEWLPSGIHPSELDLRQNLYASRLRQHWIENEVVVSTHPQLRWVSAVHLPWQLLGLGVCVAVGLRIAKRQRWFFLLLCSVPVVYSTSFILANVWRAFRYLYPSTLLIQVFAITWLSFWLCKGISRLVSNRVGSGKEPSSEA